MGQWDSDYYQLSAIVWPLSVGCRLLAVGFRLTDLRRRGDRAPLQKNLSTPAVWGWRDHEVVEGGGHAAAGARQVGTISDYHLYPFRCTPPFPIPDLLFSIPHYKFSIFLLEAPMNKKTTMPEDRSLLERAKELRKNMTQEERKLWYLYLSKHPLRFYRQKIIGHYICDFYCPVIRLVIELDGSQHYTEKEQEYDKKRTAFLESCHIKVIRFYNGQVNLHFKEVCMEIEKAIAERR